jgi:hypothetical protein
MQLTETSFLLLLQADWDDILGEIIGLVSVIGFFLVIFGVVWLANRKRLKEREFVHKERLALIEKGGPLPENMDQLLVDQARGSEQDLRAGLIWLFTGIGVSVTSYFIEASRPYWAGGLIAVFIGLGYLLNAWISSRREQEQNQKPRTSRYLSPSIVAENKVTVLSVDTGLKTSLPSASDVEEEVKTS